MASQKMPITNRRMSDKSLSDDSSDALSSEPYNVYTEVFLQQMIHSGFELVSQNFDDSRQLHCRFGWTSQCIDTNICSLLYGKQHQIFYEVDVIGIPYGSFLLLQALFTGKNASEFEPIKLKLRCLPSLKNSSSPKEFQKEYAENRYRLENELLPQFIQKIISVFSVQLDDLPLEIKFIVLSMLPLNSLVNMACVSSLWRDISLDENLWKLMVRRHFPDLFSKRVFGQSWKAIFKEEFRRLRVLNRRRAFSLGQDGVLLALPPSPRILPIGPPPNFPMLLPTRQRQLEVRAPFYMQEFINGPQMDILDR